MRSALASVEVRAEPPVLAGAALPGGEPEALAPTPATLPARHVWHGLTGIAEIVLRRADASIPVEIVVEDASRTGVLIDWPAASASVPAPSGLLALLVGAMLIRRHADRPARWRAPWTRQR